MYSFRHIQLLAESRCLVVTENEAGYIKVFLERANVLGRMIDSGRAKKQFHRDRLGEGYLIAYDERTRTLALCGTDKVSPAVALNFAVIFLTTYTEVLECIRLR